MHKGALRTIQIASSRGYKKYSLLVEHQENPEVQKELLKKHNEILKGIQEGFSSKYKGEAQKVVWPTRFIPEP